MAAAVTLAAGGVGPQGEGFTALYNLDFERALAVFEKERAAQPEDPETWNHIAQVLLHRRLYAGGALDSSAFAGNRFLKRPKVEMPAGEQRQFDEATGRAMEICERRLAADPKDGGALYALGVAYAHRAQRALLVKKAYWEALREGAKGREAHERLERASPGDPDALLIPGLHEYVAGSLPWFLRGVVLLAGLRGDKARGIQRLEEAAARGRRTAVEARVMLAVVYRREKEYGRAAALMGALSEAFPRNHLYRAEEILLLAEAGQKARALEQAGRLGRTGLVSVGKIEELRKSVEMITREKGKGARR